MKILALDSSGVVATTALVEDDNLIAEYTINYKKTHSQTLLPMIDEIIQMTETDMETIDAIAVAGGPGSFTGLRIGSATAKGLGLALNKPIVNVPTVDGLAYNMCGTQRIVCPIMDAKRNQVYTGIYEFQNNDMKVIKEQMAVDVMDVIGMLNELNRPVVFVGDGIPVYKATIQNELKVPFDFAPLHMSRQRAGALGALAIQYLKAGKVETATEHEPDYLRLSQAERERLEKEKLCQK